MGLDYWGRGDTFYENAFELGICFVLLLTLIFARTSEPHSIKDFSVQVHIPTVDQLIYHEVPSEQSNIQLGYEAAKTNFIDQATTKLQQLTKKDIV